MQTSFRIHRRATVRRREVCCLTNDRCDSLTGRTAKSGLPNDRGERNAIIFWCVGLAELSLHLEKSIFAAHTRTAVRRVEVHCLTSDQCDSLTGRTAKSGAPNDRDERNAIIFFGV